jgi:hypothetical protein
VAQLASRYRHGQVLLCFLASLINAVSRALLPETARTAALGSRGAICPPRPHNIKSHRQAQRFLSAHDQINLIFCPRRNQLTAISYRHARSDAFSLWADYTAELAA